MSRFHPRILLNLVVALITLMLVAALAMPVTAGQPQNDRRNAAFHPGDQNGCHIQGTADGSITISADSESVDLSLPTDTVDVEYTKTDSVYTLESLRIMVEPAEPGSAPDNDWNHICGTAAGSITVTDDNGTAITFTLSTVKVKATYTSDDTIDTLVDLRVFDGNTETDPTPPAPDNDTESRLEGIVSGSITLSNENETITLIMPEETVTVEYCLSDSTNILQNLVISGQYPAPGSSENECLIVGLAEGSIILTTEDGEEITLTMPEDTVEAFYTVTDDGNILSAIRLNHGRQSHHPKDNRTGQGSSDKQDTASSQTSPSTTNSTANPTGTNSPGNQNGQNQQNNQSNQTNQKGNSRPTGH